METMIITRAFVFFILIAPLSGFALFCRFGAPSRRLVPSRLRHSLMK
jgi:hypothetical protein